MSKVFICAAIPDEQATRKKVPSLQPQPLKLATNAAPEQNFTGNSRTLSGCSGLRL